MLSKNDMKTKAHAITKKSATLYLVGGGISTVIHYAISCFLHYFFNMQPLATNAIAFFVSLIFSFSWHKRFTFESDVKIHSGYAKFCLIGLAGLVCSQIIMWLTYHVLGIGFLYSQLIAIIILPPITYVLNHNWTFKPSSR